MVGGFVMEFYYEVCFFFVSVFVVYGGVIGELFDLLFKGFDGY